MITKIVPINAAVRYLLALVERVASALPRAQVLSLCGDILARLVPYLEREHFTQLAVRLRNIDADSIGMDDEGANLLFELGGRTDLVVTSEAAIEVPVPPGPEVDG